MTSEVDQKGQGQVFLMCHILFISDSKFPLGWDPSRLIKICRSLTRFLFGVGSDGINQDLSLSDQISLRGGISYFHLNDLLPPSPASIKKLFVSIMSIFYILSMPQGFEQSLFLFPSTPVAGTFTWKSLPSSHRLEAPAERPTTRLQKNSFLLRVTFLAL